MVTAGPVVFTRPIARPPSPPVAHPPVTGARLLRAGARLLRAGARLLATGARLLRAGVVLPASGAPAPTDPTDALRSPFSSTTLLAHRAEGAGRDHGEARGAPGVGRGEDVSESVAKASRARIGREKKRGISTILFTHPDGIQAFATDLDNWRHRGPLGSDWSGSA